METSRALAQVERRNGRWECAAGAACSPEGIDRMETASLSNEAKSDQAGEAQSRMRSLETCDLEDLAIFYSHRAQFFSPYAATVDG